MQSISKSKLSQYISLKQKKYRNQLSLYSISGLKAVETAIESKNIQLEALLIRQDQTDETRPLVKQLKKFKQIPIYYLNKREFKRLSDEISPQGITIIVRKPDSVYKDMHMEMHSFIYLDRINDPGNLGTIIRTAAWFGITQILLSHGSADPFQPKTTRASAGLISHIKIYENVTVSTLYTLKKNQNFILIGVTVHGKKLLEQFMFDHTQKYGLIFGSEAHGIHEELNQVLDEQISIQRYGIGESLNLATSIAIFLNTYRKYVQLRTKKNA